MIGASLLRGLALALLAASTACSVTSEGAPVSTSPRAPDGNQGAMAPSVTEPRDISAFGNTPCEIFAPDQLTGFGLDQAGSARPLPGGVHFECTWQDTGSNGELRATAFPDSDILEREYSNRETYPVFEPIEIAGMPAIMRQNSAGSSRCVVVVGLAERQGLNVGFTDLREPYEDPCGAARMAAEVAVGNLPPLG